MCLSIAIARPEHVLEKGSHLGFEWIIVENGRGYRCGYVKVTPGHPWFGKRDYDLNVEVHGGLTFSEPDVHCGKGGSDNGWWLGFDCAHGGDAPDPSLNMDIGEVSLQKLLDELVPRISRVIRTQEYVKKECESLCEQAKKAEITTSA